MIINKRFSKITYKPRDRNILLANRLPPIRDKLLVWLPGKTSATERLDGYKVPGNFPMELKQSYCLSPDGTTDSGITSIAHGTLVSSGGTSTVTYSGSSLTMTAGTVWRLEFSDGTIYPLAEGSGATCFDTTGNYSIALTSGNLISLRAGRQDEYFYTTTDGFGKRENRLLYSEDFGESAWILEGNTVINQDEIHWVAGSASSDRVRQSVPVVDRLGMRSIYTITAPPSSSFSDPNVMIYMLTSDSTEKKINIGVDEEVTTFVIDHTTTNTSIAFMLYSTSPVIQYKRFKVQYENATGTSRTEPTTYQETKDYTFDGAESIPFLNDHRGSTWNGSEVKQSFKQTQVITADGATDLITLSSNPGTIVSSLGTSTPTFTYPTINFTAGSCYQIEFSDGTIIPLDEGSGTDIHDSFGNLVGTVTSGNLTDFWANKVTPQALLDMDAPYDFFFDPLTKDPLLIHEDDMNELGGELISNGNFTDGNSWWVTLGTVVTFNGNTLTLARQSGDSTRVESPNIFMTAGVEYNITFDMISSTAELRYYDGSTYVLIVPSGVTGVVMVTVTPQLDTKFSAILFDDGVVEFKSISVREVNPTFNTSGQYFKRSCPTKPTGYSAYDQVLITDGLAKAKDYNCI